MISIQSAEGISVESTGEIPKLLRRAAQETLEQAGALTRADLSIVITSDDHLQELNLRHLGIDATTDVLSFPAEETDPDTGDLYLGDILISYPSAQAQSETGGHTLQDELQLLVVHGVLHLLGYDHAEPEEKRRMWHAQENILNAIGCQIPESGQMHE
jgi:probable rRNA maturation factor